MFAVANNTISREAKGVIAFAPESSDIGELRMLTYLVMDACEQMLLSLPSLIMDPFASHVICALRSTSYKVRQGPVRSVFSGGEIRTLDATAQRAPPEFAEITNKLVLKLRKDLGDNDVRELAADKVASPVPQVNLWQYL
ncbi:uncharacterized protein LAESUDRAFT_761685 [Laetiporus sulphureus 93-53]|uniref:Uncharacterized protein n=1 Tax=Laetiporus sulphureus 93-53 TaxID=1314785 RepID=A0A165CZV8_9APHY|nr:uncharacterized protein LAESUDRAFT_761685 [Laetiporus sulphureus 93-53]KZT03848.1 hypothetical protein LAESUDRAFT_761685 [Laetiporus sulphureus 93-53]